MRQLLSIATHNTTRKARVVFALLLASVLAFAGNPRAGIRPQTPPAENVAALLEGFRHVEVASVSDALEQLTGRKICRFCRNRSPEKGDK